MKKLMITLSLFAVACTPYEICFNACLQSKTKSIEQCQEYCGYENIPGCWPECINDGNSEADCELRCGTNKEQVTGGGEK